MLSDKIFNLLGVSIIVSSIVMMLIQKFKSFAFITKEYQIGIINFLFPFLFGIPFSIYFYEFTLIDAYWVSIFSVIGASSIYDILKNQNMINYKPKSLDDAVIEIRREDE